MLSRNTFLPDCIVKSIFCGWYINGLSSFNGRTHFWTNLFLAVWLWIFWGEISGFLSSPNLLFFRSSISVSDWFLFSSCSPAFVSSHSFRKLSPSSSDADTDISSVFKPLWYASRGITFWDKKSSFDANFWATNGLGIIRRLFKAFRIFSYFSSFCIISFRTQIGDLCASHLVLPSLFRCPRTWLDNPILVSNQPPHSWHVCSEEVSDFSIATKKIIRMFFDNYIHLNMTTANHKKRGLTRS